MLNADNFFPSQLTTEMCLDYRRNGGFSIAGTQYGNQCFGGNEITPKITLPESACNMRCGGGQTQMCGGDWAMNIYYL